MHIYISVPGAFDPLEEIALSAWFLLVFLLLRDFKQEKQYFIFAGWIFLSK